MRVIKTHNEYKKAIEEAETLIAMDPDPSTNEGERLDLLTLLIENYERQEFPIELPDPIDAIKFRMDERGLKQRDLIPYIGSKSKVSEILSGKRSLTVSMIRALHEGLGIPIDVLVRKSQSELQCQDQIDWWKLPFKEIIRKGWLVTKLTDPRRDAEKLAREFLDPIGGQDFVGVFCRRTLVERSGRTMDKYALWAWVARVLIRARSMQIPPYSPKTVDENFMKRVASFSLSDNGPIRAREFLAEHGIALVIESHLSKTYLDGAAMLSTERKPVIGLTLRHDRIDNFWFNLMHELVHVHNHLTSPDEAFLDDLDSGPGKDPREKEADRLAHEILIPRSIWKRSDAYRQRTPDAIQELALRLKIHPAIIAGRIRYDARNYYILPHMVGTGKVRKLFPDVKWD